jgi:hypothetical protein
MADDCSRAFNSQTMNKDELSQWILRRLGGPVWCVELTADHLSDAIEDAVRWFASKKGMFKLGSFQIESGRIQYQLPDDVDIVLDMAFPAADSDISLLFSPYLLLDEKVPYDVFAAPQSVGIYSSYVQTMQYIETAKRILNAEQTWEQHGRCLFLHPAPKRTGPAIYEYKTSIFNIDQLPERDHYLIKEYALARAMMDLGLIRSKFASFPSAQGEATMNGDRLIEMATERMEKLNEEIMLSAFPMKFLTG